MINRVSGRREAGRTLEGQAAHGQLYRVWHIHGYVTLRLDRRFKSSVDGFCVVSAEHTSTASRPDLLTALCVQRGCRLVGLRSILMSH